MIPKDADALGIRPYVIEDRTDASTFQEANMCVEVSGEVGFAEARGPRRTVAFCVSRKRIEN